MFRALVGSSALVALAGAHTEESEKEERIIKAFKGRPNFLWGTATAAYQVEGAWEKDGRQQSMWDHFTHDKGQGHVYMDETGDRADEFYFRWEEDLLHLDEYGFNSFRMSISWPRIYPKGEDGVHRPNPKGIEFYKNVINFQLATGVIPSVTIYHWDLPDDYDWLNDSVVDAFVDYSDFLFRTFPEVAHWITFNEPFTFCVNGYGTGLHAPGIASEFGQYVCGHNMLKAHAKAVANYRANYQKASGGVIGITINYDWTYPWTITANDEAAAQLRHDFALGWWADPIWLTGDYPDSMRQRLGDNLPKFTDEEKVLNKGSADFFGMNIYSGIYAKWNPEIREGYEGVYVDPTGKPIGPQADSPWLYVVPNAIKKYLEYIHKRYHMHAIYVTENGCDVPGEVGASLETALNDTFRLNYYRDYLEQAAMAVMESDIPLKGYYAWSLLDNFEWADGYKFRFGLTYVNYTSQKRYSKSSGKWFKHLLSQMGPVARPEDVVFEPAPQQSEPTPQQSVEIVV